MDDALSVSGNATILLPRPPAGGKPSGAAPKQAPSKPGRKLSEPAVNDFRQQGGAKKFTEIVSRKILERFTALSEAFIHYDTSHSGAIERRHIEQGFRSKGIDLSEKSINTLCQKFSAADNPALVDYWALCGYLEKSMSKTKTAAASGEVVEIELRNIMDEHFRSFEHAFLCFDVERSGKVGLKEFAQVLERFGILLSETELTELERQTALAVAEEARIVPARKKRDVIFGGEQELSEELPKDPKDAENNANKNLKIKYKDFVRHFRKVIFSKTASNKKKKKKKSEKPKRGKNVGHNAGHKIFGTKATALEGKHAQEMLARGVFLALDEIHDAVVFFANESGIPKSRFSEVLLKFGITSAVVDRLITHYSTTSGNVNYVNFFDNVFASVAGPVAADFFRESRIILQAPSGSNDGDSSAASLGSGIVPPQSSLVAEMVKEVFVKEGVARICDTWRLFDRSGGGKIQGGEFINALRNMRSGRLLPQNKATALSELYDLDGTGRCDYVAFARSFRQDLIKTSNSLKSAAASRRSSLLVKTERNSEEFRRIAEDKARKALIDSQAVDMSKVKKKRQKLLSDSRIRSLVEQKRKSPRFRASFDAHNLISRVRSHLASQWRQLKRSFRSHDPKNQGVVSPSRFARILLSATAKQVSKQDVERLALAFIEFQGKGKTPKVSYDRFMRQLVLKPRLPSSPRRSRPASSRMPFRQSNVLDNNLSM